MLHTLASVTDRSVYYNLLFLKTKAIHAEIGMAFCPGKSLAPYRNRRILSRVYNTPYSTTACPHLHSSPTGLWSKHFLLFVSPGCSHLYLTKCGTVSFHLISILQEIIFEIIRCFRFTLTFNQLQTQLIA